MLVPRAGKISSKLPGDICFAHRRTAPRSHWPEINCLQHASGLRIILYNAQIAPRGVRLVSALAGSPQQPPDIGSPTVRTGHIIGNKD
jgi:hypothetical protein